MLLALGASLSCRATARALLEPESSFDEMPAPTAPDYSDPSSWAALPDRVDGADVAPAGESDGQAGAEVDVFFIHPTTYYSDDHWNQPLDDARANKITDTAVLPNQASAFNAAARVYAPRYRQATLGVFLKKEKTDSYKALRLAYEDVRSAFQYYLDHYNEGRPIIIASHSQGTRHSISLLSDFFAGKPLHDQLVAAYSIGFALPLDHFDRTLVGVPPCRSETDVGCLINWATMLEGGDIGAMGNETFIPYGDVYESNAGKRFHCTNPLTWTIESAKASAPDHVGAVKFKKDDPEPPIVDRNYVTSARCDQALLVELPDRKYRHLGKNLHMVDYSLFYMDIRKNAVARATAYMSARRGAD